MEKYNIRDTAQMCGVKVRTVRDWIRRGKIRAEKQENGWYWHIPSSEIKRIRHEDKD
jgi:predicted site-specific integrase-resolvase